MTVQIPPDYSAAAADNSVGDLDVPPPTYTAPTQFNIGILRTSEPLVNISQIKSHLALLHAFAQLKKQVEGLEDLIPQMPDPERRWSWFVALAVERSVSTHFPRYFRVDHILFFLLHCRFDIWSQELRSSDAEKSLEETLPPVDVLMVCTRSVQSISLITVHKVWHAYMLNPMYVLRRLVTKHDC